MRRVTTAIAVTLLALALPGCFSLGGESAPKIRRHSIDLPALPVAGDAPRFGPILVHQFTARSRYEPRVVAVDEPGRVTYLELDRWVEEPSEAVTTVVREQLAASGAFEAVAFTTSEMETDLVLDGALLACDVVRTGDGPWGVRLVLRLEVTRRRSGELVSSAAFEARRDLVGADTSGLGDAMGACIGDVVDRALGAWGRPPPVDSEPDPFDG